MKIIATAVREDRHWLVRNDTYPSAFTTVTRLADAAEAHREAVAFVAGVPAAEIEVEVEPVVDERLADLIAEARAATRDAERAQRVAATLSRQAVARLRAAGLTGVDTAAVLGVSPQRVSQLGKTA
ncbi:MAG: hypothetical protein IR158_11660 [Cellulomonas sp.]|uniref:hypothetical protein n=1 Tax=Cellulomonas sp. TaxID=40001 RepID=UPI0019E18CDD|nr:hypothetical protein [Cellulomonas sp.]MBF0688404.1 hypothetical protein [Cellulomonas sp.]